MIADYEVKGMSCEHCVASVTSELIRLSGVEAVSIDLVSGTVSVTSDTPIPLGDVATAIDEAGYELAGSGQSSHGH